MGAARWRSCDAVAELLLSPPRRCRARWSAARSSCRAAAPSSACASSRAARAATPAPATSVRRGCWTRMQWAFACVGSASLLITAYLCSMPLCSPRPQQHGGSGQRNRVRAADMDAPGAAAFQQQRRGPRHAWRRHRRRLQLQCGRGSRARGQHQQRQRVCLHWPWQQQQPPGWRAAALGASGVAPRHSAHLVGRPAAVAGSGAGWLVSWSAQRCC